MSYIIIIRGPLGVGKTTVAQALTQHLDAYYVSIDEVMAINNLDKTDEECIPAENFMRAFDRVQAQVQDAVNTGQVVIFDGNFYYQQQLLHIEQQVDVPIYGFTLQAPIPVCVERDSYRQQVYGIEAATAVHNMVSLVDYGIVIDTEGQSITQTVSEIVTYLP